MGNTPDYSKHTLYEKTKKLDKLVGDEAPSSTDKYFGTDKHGKKGWHSVKKIERELVWDSDLQVFLVEEDC